MAFDSHSAGSIGLLCFPAPPSCRNPKPRINFAGKYDGAAEVALALADMSSKPRKKILNLRVADERLIFYVRSSMVFVPYS
jgi:hypothetical protein